jgi:hypothetical protein
MTVLGQAREAVYQRFVDQYTSTPFTFENESFSPPETAWVRISVRNTAGGQETLGRLGNRRFRRSATIVVQVFTPLDAGMSEGDTLANEVLGIFEAVEFGDLDTNDGLVRESPSDGKWNIHIVQVSFQYDEIK